MTQDPYAPNNARLLSMQKWYRSIEQDGQICVGEGYPTIQLTKERKGDHGVESSTNADKGELVKRRGWCGAAVRNPKTKIVAENVTAQWQRGAIVFSGE